MSRATLRLERLFRSVRWGIAQALEPRELVPMLEALLRVAPPRSAERLLALQHLSRHLVESSPFRAARLALEALAIAEDDQTYTVLGIAHTVLGNYRSARAAYYRALAMDPANWYCLHNLGHLLDVAFDRPAAALPYLRAAYLAWPGEPELAASYAHALGRVGEVERARGLLRRALGAADDRADRLLDAWLAAARPAPSPPNAAKA